MDQAPPYPRRFIAGKSIARWMASLMAAEAKAPAIDGVISLSCPFHTPGKPTQTCTAHLTAIACPTRVLQGERIPLGNRAMVETQGLQPPLQLAWLPDCIHDFTPRKAAGVSTAALAHVDGFIAMGCRRSPNQRYMIAQSIAAPIVKTAYLKAKHYLATKPPA